MDSGVTNHMTGHLDNLFGVCQLSEPRQTDNYFWR